MPVIRSSRLFYCTSYRLNMFQALLCPSSGARDYFIVLLIGSTCFRHYYARHQELATMILITTLVVSIALKPGHYSSLPAPNFQPTATQEREDQCGNQRYSSELLMMGIVVHETC